MLEADAELLVLPDAVLLTLNEGLEVTVLELVATLLCVTVPVGELLLVVSPDDVGDGVMDTGATSHAAPE